MGEVMPYITVVIELLILVVYLTLVVLVVRRMRKSAREERHDIHMIELHEPQERAPLNLLNCEQSSDMAFLSPYHVYRPFEEGVCVT